jgi:hypothetical protein
MVAQYKALHENHDTTPNIDIHGRIVYVVNFTFSQFLRFYLQMLCFITFLAMLLTLSNFCCHEVLFKADGS